MKRLLLIFILLLPVFLYSQQVADKDFNPPIIDPEYQAGEGPVVFIDEGHNNFHTKNGRYKAFSDLLERDGYQVKAFKGEFTREKLDRGKILVISNALNKKNIRNWYLPTPSAFTQGEIEKVKQWVQDGGSLFLIADHMPMAGAASDLAAAFGFEFTNGFAMDTTTRAPDYFKREDKTLRDNIITNGRNENEKVTQVVTFTGQAFQIPSDAEPILVFSDRYVNYLPDTAWVFNENTVTYNLEGWIHIACKKHGKGRVMMSGEAAMFSAQLAGEQKFKFGMNSDFAKENYQLLLNIIHWLDGKLD
jgi:hypothetical protein